MSLEGRRGTNAMPDALGGADGTEGARHGAVHRAVRVAGEASLSAGSLNARQRDMLERIASEGEVKVAELKERFRVTEMTIRRDLEKLEAAGPVRRTFGGAIYVGNDVTLPERAGRLLEQKMRIGRAAAALVQPGESVFLDGGTTTQQVARYLPAGAGITVVTNAMNVAMELSSRNMPVLVTGGTLVEATSSLVGPVAAQTVSGMAFDRAFLGATGVTAEHGFSNSNIYEAEIKRLVIRQSRETNVVFDHTKFGATQFISFAALGDVDRIVTDGLPDEALRSAFEQCGVQTIVG